MQSLSVSQLALHIKSLIESDPILCDIWVSGEVSNLSRPASGHSYFTIKDESAQLRCALFRQRANPAAGAALENGAQVLVHGHISLYEARGELQVYVDAVQPAGIGVLAAEFERLREQLEAEGLFAFERKRPLPPFPRKIGVVTSPTGAVFHDICNVLTRRWPLVEVLLAPTLVQGDGAVRGIVRALERLNRREDVDVIVVARGGGSMEDLWAFNEEPVARALFASRIPVVSAVGHETDYTIADFVADRRAPTPSAAAELLVPDQIEIALHVGARAQRLRSELRYLLDRRWQDVDRTQRRLEQCRPNAERLTAQVSRLIQSLQGRLKQELLLRSERLEGSAKQLLALSPAGTLARGYALVQREDGGLLGRAADAHPGERLRVRMADGNFNARVDAGNGATARTSDGVPRAARARAVALEQSRLL